MSAAKNKQRLVKVELDEESIGRSNPDVEHEREVAIYDLLEQNFFAPEGDKGGPYVLRLKVDGSRLVQREDDQEDKVRTRLEEYREKTEPLIGYYEEKGLLRKIDAGRSADEVRDQIRATLAMARLEEQV